MTASIPTTIADLNIINARLRGYAGLQQVWINVMESGYTCALSVKGLPPGRI